MKYPELNDTQRRGFDIVVKILNRKYPFIVGWDQYVDWKDYNSLLFLDLVIDLEKYKEYFNVPLSNILPKESSSLTMLLGYLSTKEDFERVNDLSAKINNSMEMFYKNLPSEFVFPYPSVYEGLSRSLRVGVYRFINPPTS
jgi:hypothetical protein